LYDLVLTIITEQRWHMVRLFYMLINIIVRMSSFKYFQISCPFPNKQLNFTHSSRTLSVLELPYTISVPTRYLKSLSVQGFIL